MNPRIAGGADRVVCSAIGIGEMIHVTDGDRAVIAGRLLHAVERPGLVIQRYDLAVSYVGPGSHGVRHEAHPPGAIAIVEAIHGDGSVFEGEVGANSGTGVRITR